MHGEKVLIGLSGGINSMAVLCWLHESGIVPSELHLYYAHFQEHSPDTYPFVRDGIRFARKHFPNVHVKITRNSALRFFREAKMIPHPIQSPCSRLLKIEPVLKYCEEHGIYTDLVGYVRHELKRRTARQKGSLARKPGELEKLYPIGEFTDEWCFDICDKYIGWHPAIYDIRDEKGKRVFKHNNCLPCKNMDVSDMEHVKTHYPTYHYDAMALSEYLGKYWGRDKDDFYSTFGRDLGQESTCGACVW